MPGTIKELKIGPFSGGINNHSDKSAIADAESVDCINFDIDLDGSLISRPPWTLWMGKQYNGSLTDMAYTRVLISGTYTGYRWIVYQFNYPIDTGTGGNGLFFRYLDGPSANVDVPIAGPIRLYTTAIRYNNEIFLVPSPGQTDGIRYNFTTNTATTVTGMPGGNAAIVYKSSMYVGGGIQGSSRIRFSALLDFNTWPSTNFFDINPGDGDAVQDFLIYQDNILIAKDNSTYVLAYDSNPAQAIVRLVDPSIGVTGPDCLVAYEGSVFFMYYDRVYEMVNYDFTRINTKVPFDTDKSININTFWGSYFQNCQWRTPFWIATVGDRLLCRFYNRLYVYQLRIRSWTRWTSQDDFIQYVGVPVEIDQAGADIAYITPNRQYLAGTSLDKSVDANGNYSGTTQYQKLVLINDDFNYDSSTIENGQIQPEPVDIKCTLITKIYDIGLSHRFKRLMHWGVDVVSARDVVGTLYPFSVAYRSTWESLENTHWGDLNTWNYPLFTIPQFPVSNNVASGVLRRFIRFPKSLRFRLLQFQVDMVTVGNTADGPARLYTITAFISSKQLVPAAVN